jgi:hypothetical protein
VDRSCVSRRAAAIPVLKWELPVVCVSHAPSGMTIEENNAGNMIGVSQLRVETLVLLLLYLSENYVIINWKYN